MTKSCVKNRSAKGTDFYISSKKIKSKKKSSKNYFSDDLFLIQKKQTKCVLLF